MTPAVVVNGKMMSQGRVPKEAEFKRVLQSELGVLRACASRNIQRDPPCPGCVAILAMGDATRRSIRRRSLR